MSFDVPAMIGDDHPQTPLARWAPVAAIMTGLALWVVAGILIVQDADELAADARPDPAPARTLIDELEAPDEIAFLPSGGALVAERAGHLQVFDADGRTVGDPIAVPDAHADGKGELLDLAIDPAFSRNRYVYLHRATKRASHVTRARLVRGRLVGYRVVLTAGPRGPIEVPRQ